MGEVESLSVEEPTEPPIGAPSSRPTSRDPHTTNTPLAAADDGSRASKSETVIASTSSSVTNDSPDWHEQYKYAHTLTVPEVSRALGVSPEDGLSSAEASSRYKKYGPNKVKDAQGIAWWQILLRQVSNSLTVVLLITMALSFGIDDYIEGGVITAVIVLNIVVGFIQDYHAEKTIMSLYALSAPISKVVRDGHIVTVKAETLVIGDVVQLAVGDMVPADLRLFDGMNVSTDEALLTGESLPASKNHSTTFAERDLPLGDRTNLAFSGSTVTAGRAQGIVIATGMDTEVGKIAELLRQKAPQSEDASAVRMAYRKFIDVVKNVLGLNGTPLQVKLSKFALLLFALAITIAIVVFSANLWDISGEVLIYGICCAVAVIPESLIAVLTITVAMGTKAMSKNNVIVRKLTALEAVGGVTNICSDKTGTLTQGKMIARTAWIPDVGSLTILNSTNPVDPTNGTVLLNDKEIDDGAMEDHPGLTKLLQVISLCNLSSIYKTDASSSSSSGKAPATSTQEWVGIGEPTEVALHVLAMRLDFGKQKLLEDGKLTQLAEFPFDSACKRMTVVYQMQNASTVQALTKGATEVLLPLLAVSEEKKEEIQSRVEKLAGEGLRVLCIAHRNIPVEDGDHISVRASVEKDLQFVGLIGLYDPPRLETAEAVRRCQMAGITVHMLTGDHIKTATAIAAEVGIIGPTVVASAQAGTAIMPADAFDKLSDEEIDAIETLPLVLARCSPSTKVRMVEAMHRRKAFCVMTGDGVNDSPALKRADVGIAMGMNGSDVAKEAADMVLTDDNFASIVKSVEEGRRLFDNIQKFLMHLLISNIAQVILLLIGLAFKDAEDDSVFPLSPLEILWANLITSSFLALGLGLEEPQSDIMLRPPHDLRVGVFTRELITDKFIYGFFMGALCLASFSSVVYGVGGGDLGVDCNAGWNNTCDVVFRARATTYATLSFLLLITAWEVKHFSRSLFNLNPHLADSQTSVIFSVFPTLWRNRFLFWAVVAGFVITFPVVYIPVINREVFKHSSITWEWGIVFACLVVYIVLVESWKAIKRRFKIGSGGRRVLTERDAEMRAGLTDAMLAPVEKTG